MTRAGGIFVFALVAIAAACTTFTDARSSSESDAGSPDASTGSDATPNGAFCNQHTTEKLCDDFEDGQLLGPPWRPDPSVKIVSANVLTLAPPSGSDSAHLRVAIPAVGPGAVASIDHDIIAPTKPLTLAFTLKVSDFAQGEYVEVAQISSLTTSAAAGIDYFDGSLELFAEGFDSITLGGDPKVKRRYVLTASPTAISVKDGDGNLLGDIEGDGGVTIGSDLRLQLGLVYTRGTAGGTLDIDDVVLDY